MSGFIPIDRDSRRAMLAEVGLDLDTLFDQIPEAVRISPDLELSGLAADGLTEMEIRTKLLALAEQNVRTDAYDSYLGAGFYDHYRPAVIHHLTNRQEFLTAYTPYQPEISQGTLQAIFEWQTFICRLTGLDVSNSSMYDGASAAAEALLMACRAVKRNRVWISEGVNPETRETCRTYLEAAGMTVETGPVGPDGTASDWLPEQGDFAACLTQSPNYYGIVEDLTDFAARTHALGALAVASCDPVSLALLKSPGDCGIDIAVGEAQPLGVALSYGGPAVGYLAARQELLRRMPGRIAGETTDRDGKRCYVLTIQAREQHIRREKATSNICTNQALLATAASIYLALNGPQGLLEVAKQSAAKALYLKDQLVATGLFTAVFDAPFFREFALNPVKDLDLIELNKALLEEKILGGLVLPGNRWLLAVTEKKTRAQLDRLVLAVRAYTEQKGFAP